MGAAALNQNFWYPKYVCISPVYCRLFKLDEFIELGCMLDAHFFVLNFKQKHIEHY